MGSSATALAPRPRFLGASATTVTAGSVQDLDQNKDLRGAKWFGTPWKLGIGSQMLRDPHVRKSMSAIVDPIISAHWDFKPADASPLALEIADFCRFAFFDCVRWSKVMRDALRYIDAGFSVLEMTDDVRALPRGRFPNHPGENAGVVCTGFHHRPAWSLYQWTQSERDPSKIDAMVQWAPGSDGEPAGLRTIPADRLLRFSWDQEGANYNGFSPLRSSYGSWKTKLLLMIVESIKHEREHTGLPTISLPAEGEHVSEDIVAEAEQILRSIRANEKGYLILPNGFQFNWSTTSGGTTDIDKTIERCNRDIAYNVGATFLLLPSAGSSGSYALASTLQGHYEITLDNHVRFLSDIFNQGSDALRPIERIVFLNYGPDAPVPKLTPRNMPTRDWSKILPLFHNLTLSKHIRPDDVTEAFIRDAMFLPPHDPDTARAVDAANVQPLKTDGVSNEDLEESPDDE